MIFDSMTAQTTVSSAAARLAMLLGPLAALPVVAEPQAAPAEKLDETGTLLRGMQGESLPRAVHSFNARAERIDEQSKRVEQAIAAVQALASSSSEECVEPGVAYLGSAGVGQPPVFIESFAITVFGAQGGAAASFASGTTLDEVVAAVNAFVDQTGVQADIAPQNPRRVRLQSLDSHGFVGARQTGGEASVIYARPTAGQAMAEWVDYGCAFGVPACAAPAEVYLSCGRFLQGSGEVSFVLQTAAGDASFLMASGTSQASLIEAINSLQLELAVAAEPAAENPARIRIASVAFGGIAGVHATQSRNGMPLLYDRPSGGLAAYDVTAVGSNPIHGDVNCDSAVDAADLAAVIAAWGICQELQPPCAADVTGDGTVDVDDLFEVLRRWSNLPGV